MSREMPRAWFLLGMAGLHLLVIFGLTLWSVSPAKILRGNEGVLCFVELLVFTSLAFLPIGVLMAVADVARRRFRPALAALGLALIGPGLFLTEMTTFWPIERAGYLAFTHEMEPLIRAIESYEVQHGEPPSKLEELVPHFLPVVPAGEQLVYWRRSDGLSNWLGPIEADWEVAVPCGCFVGFDQIFYWPTKAYPKKGRGGLIEPIGDWAYVHE